MKICPRCSEAFPDDSEICRNDETPLRKEVDTLLGKTVAQRYRLISRIGGGRISIVYLARHVMIDRLSAIKILRPNLGQDSALCERFLREARAVNRINHENIVEISDYGEANDIVYLVMEYVPGETMRKHMSAALFAWPRAAAIGVQIASALGRAHQMGIVHRDVNPSSILLVKQKDKSETVKLIDFGVAKMARAPEGSAGDSSLGYSAPETGQAGRSDPQSDLYSLGAVLYEAISGMVPSGAMSGGRPVAGAGTPLHLSERVPHLPKELGRIVMQLLSPRPEHRQRDAFLVLDELTALLRQQKMAEERLDAPPASVRQPVDGVPITERDAPVASSPAVPSSVTGAMKAWMAASPPPSSPVSVKEYRPPDMGSHPLGELEPLCRERWLKIERALASVSPRPSWADGWLEEAPSLLGAVSQAAQVVADDQAGIAVLESKAQEVKGDLGRALDELGHDLSRAHALIANLDGRIVKLQQQRDSDHQAKPGQRDAWLWEQGALAEEALRARAWGDDLTFQLTELRKRLDAQVERVDSDTAAARTLLEEHIAALRQQASATWASLEQAAHQLHLPAP